MKFVLLIAVSLLAIYLFLFSKRTAHSPRFRAYLDPTPGKPISFGYKVTWVAIRSEDQAVILKAFNPKERETHPTNWEKGIPAAYNGYTFVSPPIEGWTLVVSPSWEEPVGEGQEPWDMESTPLPSGFLRQLSEQFGEVQFFGNHRVSTYGEWGLYRDGKVLRAFLMADGEVTLNEGPLTPIELEMVEELKASNLSAEERKQYETHGWEAGFMDDDQVMQVAAAWSLDPLTLGEREEVGVGVLIG